MLTATSVKRMVRRVTCCKQQASSFIDGWVPRSCLNNLWEKSDFVKSSVSFPGLKIINFNWKRSRIILSLKFLFELIPWTPRSMTLTKKNLVTIPKAGTSQTALHVTIDFFGSPWRSDLSESFCSTSRIVFSVSLKGSLIVWT